MRLIFSMLGHCCELDLSECTKVTDVSMLGGVKNLDLNGTNVIDV